MKRLSLFRLVAPALLVLPLALPAGAQDRSGTVEISPYGGGAFGGSLYTNVLGGTTTYSKAEVGDTGTYGLRLGYNFNRYAGLEFSWAHAQAGLYTGPSGAFAPQTRIGDFDTDTFEVNGVFSFGRGKFVPYFTVGGGANRMRLSTTAYTSSTETRFVGNLGIGAKFWITPQFGLRIDGRVRSTYFGDSNDCHNHSCGNGYYYYNDGTWYSSGEATGGISFAF